MWRLDLGQGRGRAAKGRQLHTAGWGPQYRGCLSRPQPCAQVYAGLSGTGIYFRRSWKGKRSLPINIAFWPPNQCTWNTSRSLKEKWGAYHQQMQCCGSIFLFYGSGSRSGLGSWIQIRFQIRILVNTMAIKNTFVHTGKFENWRWGQIYWI